MIRLIIRATLVILQFFCTLTGFLIIFCRHKHIINLNKMSVSNPVDSGGGLIAFDRDLQGLADQMNTVGGWAAMMDQDSV